MIEHVFSSSRGEVHYWLSETIIKDFKTIILLHGLTMDHSLFDKQVEYFQNKYNLLIWDAPAHGKSRPYTNFTYPNAAEDLRDILDENNFDSAIMIGQSMGGYIIQSFIMRYPERIKGFIAIDSCPYGEEYYSKSDKWWLRQIEWMAHLYPLKMMKKAIAKQCTTTEYAYDNAMAALEPYGKNELCHLMGIGYAGFLTDNCDMEINCPTLLLAGEYDKTGKVLQCCQAWSKNTGFPLHIIKNAAHNSNTDNSISVNQEIEIFLKSNQ